MISHSGSSRKVKTGLSSRPAGLISQMDYAAWHISTRVHQNTGLMTAPCSIYSLGANKPMQSIMVSAVTNGLNLSIKDWTVITPSIRRFIRIWGIGELPKYPEQPGNTDLR